MIDQINELPEDGWSLHPKRWENTWFDQKNFKNCAFLHLIDMLPFA